jgi:spore photoproduct lyase
MFKKLVYVEEAIVNHVNTKAILQKLNHPQVVCIAHYKDVFNQSSAEWRLQKAYQKIILAQRTDNFYYHGSDITPAFGFNHFYYNTLALNCIYDCDYCYLQGLFDSAHMVLFVNNHDFMAHTDTLLGKLNEPVYLALSYDTDLLAIENWYAYCAEWIDFSATKDNLTIEIRTKSVNINAIKHLKPHNGVVLAWTLSPDEVIKQFEPKTPAATARINAIAKAIKLGWRVRICFDPILHISNWQDAYGNLIDKLEKCIDLNAADSYSLGVFRMNKQFLKRIQSQRNNSALLYYNYEIKNEHASYSCDLKTELLNFVKQTLLNKGVIKEIATL